MLFHINGPLHKKLLEYFIVREVEGRICEVNNKFILYTNFWELHLMFEHSHDYE